MEKDGNFLLEFTFESHSGKTLPPLPLIKRLGADRDGFPQRRIGFAFIAYWHCAYNRRSIHSIQSIKAYEK